MERRKMKTSSKKSKYYINLDKYNEDSESHEEWAILLAQEKIAELMEQNKINKSELAKRLKQSKAHVTGLLSHGRNLTLRSFAKICFHLSANIEDFKLSPRNKRNQQQKKPKRKKRKPRPEIAKTA